MTSHREQKRLARKELHRRLADRAIYLDRPGGFPQWVSVRIHQRFADSGELLRGGFAEAHETVPRAVFMRDECEPVRGGLIVTRDDGIWRVDNTLPPDDITVTAEVIRQPDSQLVAWGFDPAALYGGIPVPVE